jgi:hypothetical protein
MELQIHRQVGCRTMNSDQRVGTLISGPMFTFLDGLHHTLPLAAHGVYTIWKNRRFLYVGIAGRKLDISIAHDKMRGLHDKMRGLKDRLDSHWKGRRDFSTITAGASANSSKGRNLVAFTESMAVWMFVGASSRDLNRTR